VGTGLKNDVLLADLRLKIAKKVCSKDLQFLYFVLCRSGLLALTYENTSTFCNLTKENKLF